MLNTKFFGLTINTLTNSPLAVERLVEALSPTESLFDMGNHLNGGKWRNTGGGCDGKRASNWLIVP